MRIFNCHRGQDTGGWGARLGDAFARLEPEWSFRSMYAPNAFLYTEYPADLEWDRQVGATYWKDADVVHLHNGFRTARIFEKAVKRPLLVQYHGTAFRSNSQRHLHEQRKRKAAGIVSTLDLWLISPEELVWLPSPFNLEWLDGVRLQNR